MQDSLKRKLFKKPCLVLVRVASSDLGMRLNLVDLASEIQRHFALLYSYSLW